MTLQLIAIITIAANLIGSQTPLRAQSKMLTLAMVHFSLTDKDTSEARTASNIRYHLLLKANSAPRLLSNYIASAQRGWFGNRNALELFTYGAFPRATPLARLGAFTSIKAFKSTSQFYPADVYNPNGGKVVSSAQAHNVYVDCPMSCWGAPSNFLNDLGSSSFIHVVDQYVGQTTRNRYTLGASSSVTTTIFTKRFYMNDILSIVHGAASKFGSGYNHIYNVFLPPGYDTCADTANDCYSPDQASSFAFCAYHESVDFADLHHVLFTVEPYAKVDGCAESGSLPNGVLTDSTDSVLSHEIFETITDPDQDAWQTSAQAVSSQEIGDLCAGQWFNIVLDGKTYSIQLEYSDALHACVGGP